MTTKTFAERAVQATGNKGLKRSVVRENLTKIHDSQRAGASLRAIHRTLRAEGQDVGSYTGFRLSVIALGGGGEPVAKAPPASDASPAAPSASPAARLDLTDQRFHSRY